MKTDFPTASAGSSQAPTAAVDKSSSAAHTEFLTPPEYELSAHVYDLQPRVGDDSSGMLHGLIDPTRLVAKGAPTQARQQHAVRPTRTGSIEYGTKQPPRDIPMDAHLQLAAQDFSLQCIGGLHLLPDAPKSLRRRQHVAIPIVRTLTL